MTLYEKIQMLCKREGFEISNLGEKIPGLSITKGSISKWKSGAMPRANTIKAIAEYFGVAPDYLSSSEFSVDTNTVKDNHGIIGHVHAPVKIINGSERKLSDQEIELLNLYSDLGVVEKAKLLVFASELKNNK